MSSAPKADATDRRISVWSTASLRLAASFCVLFVLAGLILIVGVDYAMIRFVEAETREGLQHQLEIMQEDAARLGTAGLIEELERNPNNKDARRYFFLVEASQGQSFSNGLTRSAVSDDGFRRNLPQAGKQARWPDQTPDMLVLGGRAADGGLLAVGRDTRHLAELRSAIHGFAVWTGLILLILTLLGGLVAGWLLLRRLDEVNRTIGRIMAGQQSERLPAIGLGREFDNLATNLNRMLERQEKAHEALKTLSEGVAHELRAPLSRLRNRLEEIEGVNDPSVQTAVSRAVEEMHEIDELFSSLLVLARVETGGAKQSLAAIDPVGLVQALGELYQPVVEDARGTLSLAAPTTGLPALTGDAGLIQQALANLIENALAYGGDTPEISLTVRAEDRYVIFSVADNGPGIPEQEREKVVRRFYRMKTNHDRAGSGLGLAMVAAVADAHGGALKLKDSRPDTERPGLCAELWLPSAE